ncbi:ABC transporter ATP-binding protein [Roseitranquillus sediminis]|uniref:ABC transporter ATP-binding protein n=1 Tax=Roseitranquillus sediminis TaxID=2809051 RepID=UPI001D0C1EF7|nr:ABC transporter ATP-binding protein [Roseitranquillus sediminis]MBM9595678.1 ABC transporter ATP-binding protein [Roseitranquillus sediminis]
MTLELRGLARRVGADAHIHPTDLTLEAGTMNVLLGPTLAGKTTLMRLMAGLDAPSEGRLYWRGEDVTGRRVQDRDVAMVYQQFINYPSMSVYDNIASPLRLMGRSADEIDRTVRETASMLKLTPMLGRRPLELSGGQQQRCAMGRALAKGAGLVLLDEPLANLDYKLREELREEIPRIFAKSGAIFVYATTEPEEALLLGGNAAALWEGRVTQFGPTPRVYRRPADATTARVFSDPPMNFMSLEKRAGMLRFGAQDEVPAAGRYEALPDGRYSAGFRPNHLELERHNAGALEFVARVAVSEITGSETFVHLDYAEWRWVGLMRGVRHLPQGSEVRVYLSPAHIYLFDGEGRLASAAPYAQAA